MTESSNPRVSYPRHPHDHLFSRAEKTLLDLSIKQQQQLLQLQLQHPTRLKQQRQMTSHSLILPDLQLLQLYYQNFHAAHPILVPLSALAENNIPGQVLTVMRYIGAHYHPDKSIRQTLAPAAVSAADSAPGGFFVQCMLLLAICEHAHDGEREHFIKPATTRALALGMQHASFAQTQGHHGVPLLEEMWRRTYWELYVVDVLLSAPRQSALHATQSDMNLPCDDALYNRAESSIPQGCMLAELSEDSPQRPHDQHFSSFAYRVEAVRLLGRVLSLSGTVSASADAFRDLDNALVEWQRQFPFRAAGLYADPTHFDEMIFQGQMIVHSAVIYLHQPFSNLPSLWSDISQPSLIHGFFFPFSSSSGTNSSQNELYNTHTARIKREAESIANQLTSTDHVERHSPFLIHAVAVGLPVLAAAYVQAGLADEMAKERMGVVVGVLKKLMAVWPWAGTVRSKLNEIIRDVV